jgi:CRISPR-associated endonuclease/helicase Cas3
MHLDSPVGWEELARVVAAQRQAMVVLNTRLDALRLLSELEAMGHSGSLFYHLSTLLCGAHRRGLLAEVRRRLGDREQVWWSPPKSSRRE